jgi:hypothetical protein
MESRRVTRAKAKEKLLLPRDNPLTRGSPKEKESFQLRKEKEKEHLQHLPSTVIATVVANSGTGCEIAL